MKHDLIFMKVAKWTSERNHQYDGCTTIGHKNHKNFPHCIQMKIGKGKKGYEKKPQHRPEIK